MKKFIIMLTLLFFCIQTSFGAILTGGVEYSVEDARIELQNNRPQVTDFLLTQNNIIDNNNKENISYLLKGITELKDRTLGLFSDGSYAVNYKNDPLHVWYYDKNGTLINTEERSSLNYPYKSYKYTPDGELVNMALKKSETETFIFSPFGRLIGHWVGQNCYDENGNVIMTRKILK